MFQLTIGILLSLFVSWIWIDYLRRIDLFERESPIHLALIFVAGVIFPFLIDVLHWFIIDPLAISKNNEFVHDLLYDILVVGLPEEIIKFLPLLLIMLFNKKLLNEPIDYLVFICTSALGFAFHENILYIQEYGIKVIASRSVLSVPGHMFDSALFAYGIVIWRYKPENFKLAKVLLFMALGVLSHGFYDFWLSYEGIPFASLITIVYFFITISLFATILGNCINNSPHYHPKKIIDSEKLIQKLFTYYGILLVVLLVFMGFTEGSTSLISVYLQFIFLRLFILSVLVVRLSRFKIIPERWNALKFEFPFSFYVPSAPNISLSPLNPSTYYVKSRFHVKIKGESFNEVYINAFYEENFELSPMSPRKSYLKTKRMAFIEKKLFLLNDETFYLTKVYSATGNETFVYYLLKAKTAGKTNVNKLPIAGLIKIQNAEDLSPAALSVQSLVFLEWVVLRPQRNKSSIHRKFV